MDRRRDSFLSAEGAVWNGPGGAMRAAELNRKRAPAEQGGTASARVTVSAFGTPTGVRVGSVDGDQIMRRPVDSRAVEGTDTRARFGGCRRETAQNFFGIFDVFPRIHGDGRGSDAGPADNPLRRAWAGQQTASATEFADYTSARSLACLE